MRITVVIGTRPEIIKMSPIIRYCEEQGLDYSLVHTGQHYSYEMDAMFFDELELPQPEYKLNVGSGTHAEQTGKIMVGLERILLRDRSDVVLVQGDTNTVLGSALSAAKLNVEVGHVEAGLRSWDRTMPEEVNRLLTDHIARYLFAPTETAETNLLREGIDGKKIWVTGNTVVDAVFQNIKIAQQRSDIHHDLGLEPGQYFLLTAHRQENVDDRERLERLIGAMRDLYTAYNLPIVFPAHPRTLKRLDEFGLSVPEGLRILDPQGYLEFLLLEQSARAILTDSGGIQEEACILHVPCITLRENTERPETLDVGANVLAGTEPHRILNAVSAMLSREASWANPFGDGQSGRKTVEILLDSR
ncbi:UDP-N-acetylglucosamine 2-epimerase (non-hydrolyzing) [Methanoculleus sp. Wushi-C6]|uniref:UDP-N-acetylglucosamine 2-epimerase (Non-hydrolyzing) n=1 Tax=Methanoculleus caldifontis TaxID=2651577 RepID=A0ABU3X1T7_9EURY|nr:UDP-N-acetylglucosamine 2-epimerase (non-hydrolyzing) [Methanoculleus sp. Wushi-C6]MDV2482018.1 UDP-N-acetylglucosamine 2-epimerase (non-hydrolyzing) [Methanoculleus sp. Wushi-C6]